MTKKTYWMIPFLAVLLTLQSAWAGTFPFGFWKTAANACTDDVFTVQSGTLVGSVERSGASCSPNGTYCFAVVEESGSTTGTWHFYYSKDSGATWVKAAFTDAALTSLGSWETVIHGYIYTPKVLVANNGKVFAIYTGFNGSLNYHTKGVISDLSAGSPVVQGSAATGVDAENSVGTAGYLCANTANNRMADIGGDLTDLSFVGVVCMRQDDTQGARFFTNGGATYQGNGGFGGGSRYGIRHKVVVTGTAGSHRTFVVHGDTGATDLQFQYYDEPSNTPIGTITMVSSSSTYLEDCTAGTSKVYCLSRRNSDGAPFYQTFTISGTPSVSSVKPLALAIDLDPWYGLDTIENGGQPYNSGRYAGKQVILNPSNQNNAFFGMDLVDGDGNTRSRVFEVRDDTTYSGIQISQATSDDFEILRGSSSVQQVAQTFTSTSTILKSISLGLHQEGSIASSGYQVTVEIQNTTSSLPNGSVVATSTTVIDPSKLTKNNSGETIHFNFPSTTIGAGVYAIVIKSTSPVDASNYVGVRQKATTNPYAGGTEYRYNGTTWVAQGSGNYDLYFEINDHWAYPFYSPADIKSLAMGIGHSSADTGIGIYDSSTISVVNRTAPSGMDSVWRREAGHTYRSLLTIGSGSNASVSTNMNILGLDPSKYDPYLIFNTQGGTSASAQMNRTTGALDANQRLEDRSGYGQVTNSTNGITTAADGAFDSGTSTEFSGSSSNAAIVVSSGGANPLKLLGTNTPFVMEAEIKLLSLPGSRAIATWGSTSTTSGGWFWTVDSGGNVRFDNNNGAGEVTVTSSTLSVGTKYKVKVVGDGAATRIYFNGVEQPYSTQNTGGYSFQAPNTGDTIMTIGAYGDNANNINARYGVFRIARGTTTFASSDYFYQPETLAPQNMGKQVSMNQENGTNSVGNILATHKNWGTTVPNSCYP